MVNGASQPDRELAQLREELLELSLSEAVLMGRSEQGLEEPRDRDRHIEVSRRLGDLT
jgi:hypothetical protein